MDGRNVDLWVNTKFSGHTCPTQPDIEDFFTPVECELFTSDEEGAEIPVGTAAFRMLHLTDAESASADTGAAAGWVFSGEFLSTDSWPQ